MKRIGVAASRIAKGNLWLYNSCVVLIAFAFSFFMFILAGATVVLSLIFIGYIGDQMMVVDFERELPTVMTLCMMTLTVMIVLFTMMAILQNIKLPRKTKK